MLSAAARSLSRSKPAEGIAFRDRAPWWGGDLQTLRNHLLARQQPLPSTTSTRLFPTSDGTGDRLMGRLEQPVRPAAGTPLIVLIHGLTGCEDSTYVRRSARFHLLRGRRVLRLNLRGAGPARKLASGYYHAGCAPDLQGVLAGLTDEDTRHGAFAVGYSLGGNILLNLLGSLATREHLVGAAVVSAPIEPREACQRIMAPRNALYHRWLLRRMKQDVLASPGLTPAERNAITEAPSVYAFDDQWVAPRNGFRDAEDYYALTAGAQHLASISVPTLLLHAMNDPWIPVRPYLELRLPASPLVEIVVARSGGHVGFHEYGHTETWHDRRIEDFLVQLEGRVRG
jgi:hypothetical protein